MRSLHIGACQLKEFCPVCRICWAMSIGVCEHVVVIFLETIYGCICRYSFIFCFLIFRFDIDYGMVFYKFVLWCFYGLPSWQRG